LKIIHADRQHRQADEPVANERTDEQPTVRRTQPVAEHQVNREHREQERYGVNRDRGQIFTEHHVHVARRQREQEFIRVLPPFLGPDGHRD
jgi:hypothetical protein